MNRRTVLMSVIGLCVSCLLVVNGCIVMPQPAPQSTPQPAPSAASFALENLVIEPNEVSPGETVTISAVVRNSGTAEGNYTATLLIDNSFEGGQDVSLGGNGSAKVTFRIAKNDPGAHSVNLNGLVGEFVIVGPMPTPTPAPTPEPQPAPAPEEMLPESPSPGAQLISGSAILEEFGTKNWSKTYPGKKANVACSECFYFPFNDSTGSERDLTVLFVVYADKVNVCSYSQNSEAGYVNFELMNCLTQGNTEGSYHFSPTKEIYTDKLVMKDGEPAYATAIVGKLGAVGDTHKFMLYFANFDYQQHLVSWELYDWQE